MTSQEGGRVQRDGYQARTEVRWTDWHIRSPSRGGEKKQQENDVTGGTISVESDGMTVSLCSFQLHSHLWNRISLVIFLSFPLQDRDHMKKTITAVCHLLQM
jgi:hypothetical protein